jgi:hypothetical protein
MMGRSEPNTMRRLASRTLRAYDERGLGASGLEVDKLTLAVVDPPAVSDAPIERPVALVREAMDAEPASCYSADPPSPPVRGVVARTGVCPVARVTVSLRRTRSDCLRRSEVGTFVACQQFRA